ncbi:hypothetical protein PR048_005189 [Dryococelus australis]|uniref:Uncharacterized protein n=1 Tax=Dryococelus australis TaxID=614101 RepID=A0ABQ9I7H0_9NEOP|nr:hypothetical protein PR048_005189 [Dryococelus australis]
MRLAGRHHVVKVTYEGEEGSHSFRGRQWPRRLLADQQARPADVRRGARLIQPRRRKHRNEREGETGDLRENPPASGIVQHDSHLRKYGSDPTGNLTGLNKVGGEQSNRLATVAPLLFVGVVYFTQDTIMPPVKGKMLRYSEQQMNDATDYVLKGTAVATAVKRDSVPRVTLLYKMTGKTPRKRQTGLQPVLTREEENVLVTWITTVSKNPAAVDTSKIATMDAGPAVTNRSSSERLLAGKAFLEGYIGEDQVNCESEVSQHNGHEGNGERQTLVIQSSVPDNEAENHSDFQDVTKNGSLCITLTNKGIPSPFKKHYSGQNTNEKRKKLQWTKEDRNRKGLRHEEEEEWVESGSSMGGVNLNHSDSDVIDENEADRCITSEKLYDDGEIEVMALRSCNSHNKKFCQGHKKHECC